MLKRGVRELRVIVVFLVALVPTVNLAAQSFSKKIAVESSKSGASLGSATVSVQREGRRTSVKLSAPTAITASAFYLDSPARLVVDVSGCKTRRSEKIHVSSNPLVSSVRVGAHTNKLRMVIDLTVSAKPDFESTVTGREVTLTVTDEARGVQDTQHVMPTPRATAVPTKVMPALPEVQVTETPRLKPTLAPFGVTPIFIMPRVIVPTAVNRDMKVEETVVLPVSSPTVLSFVSPTAVPSPAPTVQPVVTGVKSPLKEPIAKPVAPGSAQATPVASAIRGAITYLLTGYRFEYLEPGRVPILKITLSKARANAQISKVGPKAYKIVIPSCGIGGKGLDLPQFPPADFLGFVMIAAKAVDDKTEITVSVEQGVTLGTFVRQNEIWVKRL